MTDGQKEESSHPLESTPSFEGRLKLNQFMYTSSEDQAPSLRRSSRLSTPLSPTVSPIRSPRVASTTSRPGKRKHGAQDRDEAGGEGSPDHSTGTSTQPSPRKQQQRSRQKSSYAPPSTYAHLPLLADVLGPDLLILFVGLNPGVQTARSGHAYAHPSNLFWKLLFSSGITPVPCRADEDRTLPDRFALGNTNIVARPSRNGAELSKAEMDEGVAVLEDKIRKWRPEVVCIVGKSIWESIWRVRKGKAITKAEFRYGWQDEAHDMGVPGKHSQEDAETSGFTGARVFVATSTSGLAASLRPEEKERIWRELGDWCKARRKEREEEALAKSV
ncbi:hydrolase-like protein [Pestalotiopsis sp. NC0098]|nr:hydrolase-like protein [Pestalotiopsis sp. NC0098]